MAVRLGPGYAPAWPRTATHATRLSLTPFAQQFVPLGGSERRVQGFKLAELRCVGHVSPLRKSVLSLFRDAAAGKVSWKLTLFRHGEVVGLQEPPGSLETPCAV